MALSFTALAVISLCIAACAVVVPGLFRWLGRPYLVALRGRWPRLVAARLLVGLLLLGGLAAAWAGSSRLSGTVALALFFSLEAVALEIWSYRIAHVR